MALCAVPNIDAEPYRERDHAEFLMTVD